MRHFSLTFKWPFRLFFPPSRDILIFPFQKTNFKKVQNCNLHLFLGESRERHIRGKETSAWLNYGCAISFLFRQLPPILFISISRERFSYKWRKDFLDLNFLKHIKWVFILKNIIKVREEKNYHFSKIFFNLFEIFFQTLFEILEIKTMGELEG